VDCRQGRCTERARGCKMAAAVDCRAVDCRQVRCAKRARDCIMAAAVE